LMYPLVIQNPVVNASRGHVNLTGNARLADLPAKFLEGLPAGLASGRSM
jgi:hypothetical protein